MYLLVDINKSMYPFTPTLNQISRTLNKTISYLHRCSAFDIHEYICCSKVTQDLKCLLREEAKDSFNLTQKKCPSNPQKLQTN